MHAKLTPSSPDNPRGSARLRILATTDLHGHLLPHDYITDRPTQGGGLAGLARLIAEARAQADAAQIPSLLFDNGDTFQGTPLANYLASQNVSPTHPIIAALNALNYDALGLGNHDLDHGLPYLKAVARALDMPVLNSNLRGVDLRPLRDAVVLAVPLGPDAPAPLRIGVLSVLPMQSAAWNSHHLGPQARIQNPADCVAARADMLRADGADLIVVLAHMGVGHKEGSGIGECAAQALAASANIDALILGHTHRRLPSLDYADRDGVDIHESTVGSVPSVMAGHAGSDLAVMDLELSHDPVRGWQVTRHKCALRPNGANVMPDSAISALADPDHTIVRTQLSAPVATAPEDMHSYFSLVSPARTQHLMARAHHLMIAQALADTPEAALPLLATAAAHGAGGRDGLGNYLHVPKGALLRRHIEGLIPFANQAVAVRMTALQLRQWLEHAALVFNTLLHRQPQQMLVDEDVPAFQFDTIYGLEYRINPANRPMQRISHLTYRGAALNPDQEFILATTRFRAAGGGGYATVSASRIVTTSQMTLHDAMISTLQSKSPDPWASTVPWRFEKLDETSAVLLTHPDAINCISSISHLRPSLLGSTSDGFIRVSVTL